MRAATAAPRAAPEIHIETDFVVLHPVMWMFLAVLVTFVLTRTITRRIRAKQREAEVRAAAGDPESGGAGVLRNISVGGVHVHHQVLGILLMSVIGIIVFASTPDGVGLNICAALFGVGLSLAFDEFAMWLHLDDVYWSAEGRQSVDAIFVVLMVTGVLIGGADFLTGDVGTATWWGSVGGLLVVLVLAVVCLLKGKVMLGVIGIVVQPLVIIGAFRLGKPESWWGRRYYRRQPRRLARSRKRFGPRYDARWNRVRDFFGGKPDPTAAPLAAPLGTAPPAPAASSAPASPPVPAAPVASSAPAAPAASGEAVDPGQRTTVGRGSAGTPPAADRTASGAHSTS
ncbi:hypothetical protein [Nakamurella endophytica]|uniref:Integral membrane protein n=1 Tax=Nakamurella endophytica TaxID=1748367 RepID=A0A917WEW7_9ACTN|nr:hypothetical protein [Nakamurella endophytica]GGL96957.1 hypothetical protein GCM10011594_15900 [Nakamurella endophytica]